MAWLKRLVVGAALTMLATGSLGCLNYATMQSTDVVPKEELRYGSGVTYTQYRNADVDGIDTTVWRVPAYYAWARYGVVESLEIHGDFWVPLGASLGAKYQFLGEPGLPGPRISGGLDFGYTELSMGNNTSASNFDTYLPIYTGYRINDNFSTYFVPKYVLRTIVPDNAATRLSHTTAATLGIELGFGDSNTEFNIEGTMAYDLTNGIPILNIGVGLSRLL